MKIEQVPKEISSFIIPEPSGQMYYRCLNCNERFGIEHLLYTCPNCGGVLLLYSEENKALKLLSGEEWKKIFDYRRLINYPPLQGIFLFYEFIAPVIPLTSIIYLGEAHTPIVKASPKLRDIIGMDFYFKYEGLNPSASFKDRGMACALSYIKYLSENKGLKDIIAICASTGDTSASAALYSAYLGDNIKSVVILPAGKVTSQQLSQPLGHGAVVLEVPGVFDDCMKIVEFLSERYNVALLNSKNSWRILGQETFSFEIAQAFEYDMKDKAVVVPIGNAGNITAVMSGFLKFYKAGIIEDLPKIIGVQSEHADPVFRYYEQEEGKRKFVPVKVKPSVAQAAMIGNPVSMPRVIELAEEYDNITGKKRFYVVQVKEQEIMDCMIVANRNGNIVCTQGGESLAGLIRAREKGYVSNSDMAILNSTAHMLKFISFQQMYFDDSFPPEFEVKPKDELKNRPIRIMPKRDRSSYEEFIKEVAEKIAEILDLKVKNVNPA